MKAAVNEKIVFEFENEIKAILQNFELDEEEKILAILELDDPMVDEAMAERIVKGYVRGLRPPKRRAA